MSPSRREFSPQFKAEVQLGPQSGDPNAQVARDPQVDEGTLGNWVMKWREENPEPEPDLSPVDRARLRELEEVNRKLKMETSS